MIYTNGYIFDEDAGFLHGSFAVENGRFTAIRFDRNDAAGAIGFGDDDAVDLKGAYVIPGLIDLHTHGCLGEDFSDGDREGLARMAHYYAYHGITSFAPAVMTISGADILKACRTAYEYSCKEQEGCAKLIGIHMEGPYLSEARKGAQNAAYLRKPDIEEFRRFQEAAGGLIRIVDVAPELEGAMGFIAEASRNCCVSIAHTEADYDIVKRAFEAGASHLTHMFNAMPGIHHRNPGPVCAAADRDDVVIELICDGIHIHESVMRLAFRLFPSRICMISDSLRCCGMPDGEYMLGGQRIILKGKEARLCEIAGVESFRGPIAGSACDLFDCLEYTVGIGVDMKAAVNAASIIPAKVLGRDREIGSIKEGKKADFILCDKKLHRKTVYMEGKKL